jgi:ankyrin repeat protein
MSPARTLDDVLRSVSDVLFPEHLGEMPVGVGSRGAGGDTPLHVMAWQDDNRGAELLIAAGADVNAVGDMSETPLHVAVRRENVELVQLLLAAGGDPDLRSEFGETAREKAGRAGGRIAALFEAPAPGAVPPSDI